jgi:hypothetical protein
MDERARRLALNEALFREVNERIEEVGDRLGLETFEIVCECSQIECTDRIEIVHEEYERLRADATLYAVVPGHDRAVVESVIAHKNRYDIVRKHEGEPAKIARATDPRA